MLVQHERRSGAGRPATAKRPPAAIAFRKLTAAVGIRNGRQIANRLRDQKTVMRLLDNIDVSVGGNRKSNGSLEVAWPRAVEGRCHVVLFSMILRFQNFMHTAGGAKLPPGFLGSVPDGVVEPDGATERLMIAKGRSAPAASGARKQRHFRTGDRLSRC